MVIEVGVNVMREVMARISKFKKMRAQIRQKTYSSRSKALDSSSKDKK